MLEVKKTKESEGRSIHRYRPALPFLCALLLGLSACERPVRIPPATDVTESTTNPFSRTDEITADGRRLFLNNCSICHGSGGLGDGPSRSTLIAEPANLTIDPVASFADGRMFLAIRQGKMVNGRLTMPPVEKMSDEQIWKTISYVRTLSSKQP